MKVWFSFSETAEVVKLGYQRHSRTREHKWQLEFFHLSISHTSRYQAIKLSTTPPAKSRTKDSDHPNITTLAFRASDRHLHPQSINSPIPAQKRIKNHESILKYQTSRPIHHYHLPSHQIHKRHRLCRKTAASESTRYRRKKKKAFRNR